MLKKQKQNSSLGLPSVLLFNQSILDVFVLQGILELEDAEKLKGNFKTNREIENFLLKNHLVTKDTINKAYSIILKLPFIELKNIKISPETLETIPEKIALRLGIVPFDLDGTLLKIAITQPADLPLGFLATLKKLFRNKKVSLELFITGTEDFKEALKQYKNKREKLPLMKKGSLPVVYLRNRKISRDCLNKIPKSFIEKYRLLVFDENIAGRYLIASEKPDAPLTKKILQYIEKENRVKLEIFATSEEDIGFVLENYNNNSFFQIEELHKNKPKEEKAEKKEKTDILNSDVLKSAVSNITKISKKFFKSQKSPLTIDSISARPIKENRGLAEVEFQKKAKEPILRSNEGNRDDSLKSINLVGKISRDNLEKLPKEFIGKYRIVVFGENNEGSLMVATDSVDLEITQKALDFIRNQHPVEVFITSTTDIEYAMNIY